MHLRKARLLSLAIPVFVAGFYGAAPVAANSGHGTSSTPVANIVESTPLTGYQNDFQNNCAFGYYGTKATAAVPVPGGNHSESDLAVNPIDGSLLGASKFFFGGTEVPGYSDFSPQYNFHLGSYSLNTNSSSQGTNQIIPGYSDGSNCQGSGDSSGIHWTNSTDPNIAFNSSGDAFTAVLPYTQGTSSMPNGAIFVNKMAAGSGSWGAPVLASPLYGTTGNGQGPDKQWVATYLYQDPKSGKKTEYVNACWAVFHGFWGSEVYCSQSIDGGQSFWNASDPVRISFNNLDGPFNTYVYPRYDSSGTLYVSYMADNGEPAVDAVNKNGSNRGNTGVVYTVVSKDHGRTFSPAVRGFSIDVLPFHLNSPTTNFRDGIPYFMYASPKTPGRLFAVAEDNTGGNANVYIYQSNDGGTTWNASSASDPHAVMVNTSVPNDQFQPSVTADSLGNVGVAWYDRRNACPDTGETNTCIDTYAQLYQDSGSGAFTLVANGGNMRASNFTWDPRLPVTPAQPNCGDDLPHPGGGCGTSFIGDYFGVGLSSGNFYILNVSTFDYGGNPNHDQQQVLEIVPIPRTP
jgi:hypothetical protein